MSDDEWFQSGDLCLAIFKDFCLFSRPVTRENSIGYVVNLTEGDKPSLDDLGIDSFIVLLVSILGCLRLRQLRRNKLWHEYWSSTPQWVADFASDPGLLVPSSSLVNEADFTMDQHELASSLGTKFSSCRGQDSSEEGGSDGGLLHFSS